MFCEESCRNGVNMMIGLGVGVICRVDRLLICNSVMDSRWSQDRFHDGKLMIACCDWKDQGCERVM